MSRWAATSARDWGRYFSTHGAALPGALSGALPFAAAPAGGGGGAAASMSMGVAAVAPAIAVGGNPRAGRRDCGEWLAPIRNPLVALLYLGDFRSEATGSGQSQAVRVLPRRVEEGRAFGSSTIWEALAQPICNVGLDEPFVPTTLEDTLLCEALCFFLSFWKGWNGRVD